MHGDDTRAQIMVTHALESGFTGTTIRDLLVAVRKGSGDRTGDS